MSSVYGSSILNLDLVLDYNNLTNKPTIPQVGYTANGRNFAIALTDNKMFVNVPEGAISAATSAELGGIKIGFPSNGNNYAVVLDGSSKAHVVVPPSTITVASTSALGGVKIGFSESGNNYAVVLDGSSKAHVVVPPSTITVATTSALGGVKLGFPSNGNNYAVSVDGSGKAFATVAVPSLPTAYTPTSSALPEFTLTADTNINASGSTTFNFEDVNEGSSATTVYSAGITHVNNTSNFKNIVAGTYLISYFLHENDGQGSSSSKRMYGYTCIRRENSSGNLVYEYTMGGEYARNTGTPDDVILSGTTSITFAAGDKFTIRYYRLYSQGSDTITVRKSLSNLRIERISINVT